MMKITGRVTSCCVALFLALTSVSAVHKKLDSINDLKRIDFGQSVPKHSLVLLHWFANTVDIDNNNVIWLTFDPISGDYGSHHYGNFEGMLDQLPWGYRYYTIGNLYQETPMSLPSHVLHPQSLEYVGRNRDRIIIRVREQNTGQQALQRIDRVYITQHYDTSEQQGTQYDPDHTYQITTNLLRQIREFSVGENQRTLSDLRNRFEINADDFLLRHIVTTWSNLASLGLFLFIVLQEKYLLNPKNNRPGNSNRPQNNRPGNSNRPQNNNRPGNSNRLQNNNRPANSNRPWNNNRPEDDNTLENSNQENRLIPCRRDILAITCFFIIISVSIIVFLSIYFATR